MDMRDLKKRNLPSRKKLMMVSRRLRVQETKMEWKQGMALPKLMLKRQARLDLPFHENATTLTVRESIAARRYVPGLAGKELRCCD